MGKNDNKYYNKIKLISKYQFIESTKIRDSKQGFTTANAQQAEKQ